MSNAEAGTLLRGLPPIVDGRSRVLVLGSFPSEESLRRQQYYAYPRNAFWTIIEALFGIERSLPYQERTSALRECGVAVWDVIAACRREGSADTAIEDEAPNGLQELLDSHPLIAHVFFNGTKAWDTARAVAPGVFRRPGLRCERLPSTSPANARTTLARKVEAWRKLKDVLRAEAP